MAWSVCRITNIGSLVCWIIINSGRRPTNSGAPHYPPPGAEIPAQLRGPLWPKSRHSKYHLFCQRGSGGTGRRSSLRSYRTQVLGGSNPLSRTKISNYPRRMQANLPPAGSYEPDFLIGFFRLLEDTNWQRCLPLFRGYLSAAPDLQNRGVSGSCQTPAQSAGKPSSHCAARRLHLCRPKPLAFCPAGPCISHARKGTTLLHQRTPGVRLDTARKHWRVRLASIAGHAQTSASDFPARPLLVPFSHPWHR